MLVKEMLGDGKGELGAEVLGAEVFAAGILGAAVYAGRLATVVEEVVETEDENRHCGLIFAVVVSGSDLHGGDLNITCNTHMQQ